MPDGQKSKPPGSGADLVCIGGAAINRKYQVTGDLIPGTSNPAVMRHSFGGVARNVAETLARLQASVALVSMVGDDAAGRALLGHLEALGVDTSAMQRSAVDATAEYAAILGHDGELHVGLAAMDVFDALTPDALQTAWPMLAASGWVFADCNLADATIEALMARKGSNKLAVNTVSVPKAVRLPADLSAVDVLFTNADEAAALLGAPSMPPETLAAGLRARGAAGVVLTLGAEGHLVHDGHGLTHVAGLDAAALDVTGAGDALMAGTLYGLMQGTSLVDASRLGTVLAHATVQSIEDVVPDLSPAWLTAQSDRYGVLTTRKIT